MIKAEPLPYILAMFLLCLCAVRAGHESFTFNVNLLLICIDVFLILATRKINFSTAELWVFLVVAALEVPVQWVFNSFYDIRSAMTGMATLALMILNVALMIRRGYGKYLWNVVNFFSMFASVCLILQMALYMVGIRLDQMPILADTFFKAWEFTDKFRPCSLFSEPSHFAELALLSLYYYLLVSRNIRKAAILTAALLLSTSNLGIVGVAMLFVLYVINLDRNAHISSRIKYAVIMLTFLLGIGVMIWINNSSNWVAVRLLEGGTSSVRVMRSFELYDIMSLFEKLFGIGIQNQAIYLNYHSIILPSDSLDIVLQNREFAQTLGYILCTTGALGFCVFMFPFVRMLMKSDYRIKSLCLLFLFVCFTCCIFSRQIFGIYLIMIYATKDILRDYADKKLYRGNRLEPAAT